MTETPMPYNYPVFVREIDELISEAYKRSPKLGVKAPDFPLWPLDGAETSLSQIWKQNAFTVIEFGSFT